MPTSAQPVRFYVAPEGNDAWTGKAPARQGEDGPFATLGRAREEVRRLKAAGELPGPVTVLLRGGTYQLPEPLVLGPEDSGTPDSPVVWRAYQDEKPILVGARKVSGFRRWKGEILQCDLKGTPLEKVVFRQLFFRPGGGTAVPPVRMTMARYPNVDPKDPHFGTWAHVLEPDSDPKDRVFCTPDVIKDWTRVQQAEVCIHPSYGWAWMIVPIKSVDKEAHCITLTRGTHYGQMVGDRFYVQNLLEELDAPGEWYLDRDNSVLYFWPPDDLAKGEVLAPVTGSLIAMKGASHVTVRGFTLEACEGNAVTIQDCESCVVAGSVIRNCGGWAVTISGGHRSGAVGNDITATGAGGVSLGGGDRKTLERGDNFATNNYIHHIAAFQRTYNTGVNVSGVGNVCSHNLIHDCYHQAILMGGNDNTVEYNIVHHTNLGSEDTGGLYMSSRDYTMRGNIIRYNIFHHVGGFGKASSWQPVRDGKVKFEYPHFTWGIYLDAPECGVTVFGNILYSVPVCGMFNHEGRDNTWENNIIVDAPAFQVGSGNYPDLDKQSYSYVQALREKGGYDIYLQHYPELATYTDDAASHNTCAPGRFVRNIIYYTHEGGKMMRERNKASWGGGQLVWTFAGPQSAFAGFAFDSNCIFAPPDLALKFSLTQKPNPGKLLTWDEWRDTGKDEHSVLADPLFVDAANRDYRLREDSPALKLGFQQIPLDRIGPYEDELRASWPIVEAPGAAALGEFTTERYFVLPGHEPAQAKEVVPRSGLPNFAAKLAAKQPVTVAVFAGGNHAQGGWRETVMRSLREQYPGVAFTDFDASVCGCVRGLPFSVFRFEHDVLRRKPDLVFVDFASDDAESEAGAIEAALEGVVRQAWQADPKTDLVFVYAFRPGYEESYAEGVCPGPVSAYERVAQRFGIPAINMGYGIAQMAQQGRLVIRASADEAKTLGKPVFTHDGVYVTPAGKDLYARLIAEGLADIMAAPVGDVASVRAAGLAKPAGRAGLQRAKLYPVTQDMLSGAWERISPAIVAERDFSRHFDEVWFTRSPGAKLTFRFRGTEASLFDLIGPDTGRVRVSVDGQDKGTRQRVDPWCYYQRLSVLSLAAGLKDEEHVVTIELLPDIPDRSVPIAEAQKSGQYKAEAFEGVALRVGWLRLVGEPVGR